MSIFTAKQAHVLANVDRVRPLRYKIQVKAPHRRYELDGEECTRQITSLSLQGKVVKRGTDVRATHAQKDETKI